MLFPPDGNGNGNEALEPASPADLIGVTELANALGYSKGTISKHAKAGKIPVEQRDADGAPLFDLAKVRAALPQNVNENMRRDTAADPDAPSDERRSSDDDAKAGPTLNSVMIEERQVRIRSLQLKQLEQEGALVSAAEIALEIATSARATRDAVEQHIADQAGKTYAFAVEPHNEGEWRLYLINLVREAYAERDRALALEAEESDDDEPVGETGATDAG